MHCVLVGLDTDALMSYWTSFLMLILHDSSSRMTKETNMVKHFQIEVGKHFFNFIFIFKMKQSIIASTEMQ